MQRRDSGTEHFLLINPQLLKPIFTFEYKNVQLFSEWRRMRHDYSHPARQRNKDRSSRKMETASHTFLLGQFQLPLLLPNVRLNRLQHKTFEKIQFDPSLCHLLPSQAALRAPSLKSGGDYLYELSAFY